MTAFKEPAKKKIKSWSQALGRPLSLALNLPEADEETSGQPDTAEQFKALASELNALAGNLTITEHSADLPRPGFSIAENIRFCAYPMEKELDPFLSALTLASGTDIPLTEAARSGLDQVDIPVRLKLYIALFCPHCPGMVDTLIPLALHCRQIQLEIIDGSLFEDAAKADKVMSAPCLILDNDFRWTGAVSAEEIIEMINNRDPSGLGMETLKNIMEQGDAAWIAEQMTLQDKIFDAFVDLLCHPTWSVRLGAMVIIEELAETAPGLAQALCPILMDIFDSRDIPVQGDLLYALGETGGADTAAWIENKRRDLSHPDLADAAEEALESIRDRLN